MRLPSQRRLHPSAEVEESISRYNQPLRGTETTPTPLPVPHFRCQHHKAMSNVTWTAGGGVTLPLAVAGSARRFRSRGTSSQNPSANPCPMHVLVHHPTGSFHSIPLLKATTKPIRWLGVKSDALWHFQVLMVQDRPVARCSSKPAVIWQSPRPGSRSFLSLRPTCQPPKRPCAPCRRHGRRCPLGC